MKIRAAWKAAQLSRKMMFYPILAEKDYGACYYLHLASSTKSKMLSRMVRIRLSGVEIKGEGFEYVTDWLSHEENDLLVTTIVP